MFTERVETRTAIASQLTGLWPSVISQALWIASSGVSATTLAKASSHRTQRIGPYNLLDHFFARRAAVLLSEKIRGWVDDEWFMVGG
jgi:hypothetical protein